jgi:mannose-6-phosphate isomerase-like protein (cupin superfamily)
MRRVVTGHRNGKSVILDDAEMQGQGGLASGMIVFWKTDGIPVIPLEDGDYKQQLPFQFPKPGGTQANIWVCPPEKEYLKKAKEDGVDVVGEWRKRFEDDFGMHTTDTIDYDIVLSGELWMEVDDGAEVHLKPFDCVVQNGTRHAWRNRSSKNCVMLSVLIGAKRKKSTK